MIKININMPNKCIVCPFQVVAFDSEIFDDNECFCCIKNKSVETNIDNDSKPDWCPLIECK